MRDFVRVAAVDPSLRNFGMAKLMLDLRTLSFEIEDLKLIETDNQAGKTVRKNSDDLRRSQEISQKFKTFVSDCTLCFSEIPSGAQSARAALSFGIAIGILANCPIPLIQVMPAETKLAAVGTKTASKEEMIEWAFAKYPKAEWKTTKRNGVLVPTAKNEHLADAIAIAHAGIVTDEFRRMMAMWKAAA